MHLEASRSQLYRKARCFLEDEKTPQTRSSSSASAASGSVRLAQHRTGEEVMGNTTTAEQKIPGYTYGSDAVAQSASR
jgi:hypothetical protein